MHSSRIRTVRCSGHRGWGCIPAYIGQGGRVVHPSMQWAGGVCLRGCLPRGVSAQRVSAWGCLPGGVCLGGVCQGVSAWEVSAQGGVCLGVSAGGVSRHPSPCEWNDWQTGVKTLPCRNYVADGNKLIRYFLIQNARQFNSLYIILVLWSMVSHLKSYSKQFRSKM